MKETCSDQTFTQPAIEKTLFQESEFENCMFNHCDLSNRDFTNTIFIECTFTDCNLSLVKLTNTTFRDVQFTGCKMLGLMFNDCSKFGISFKFNNCTLNHSSFYQTKINKIIFGALSYT